MLRKYYTVDFPASDRSEILKYLGLKRGSSLLLHSDVGKYTLNTDEELHRSGRQVNIRT